MSDLQELTPEQKAAEKARKAAEAKAAKEAKAAEAKAAKELKAKEAKEAKELKAKEKEEAKVAKAAEREANRMPEQNGIRRPKADGLCGRVWGIADKLSMELKEPVAISDLLAECEKAEMNPNNVKAEYARWRKFNGVVGRIISPAAKEAAAAKEAEKVAKAAERKEAAESKAAEKAAAKKVKDEAKAEAKKVKEAKAAEVAAAKEAKAAEAKA